MAYHRTVDKMADDPKDGAVFEQLHSLRLKRAELAKLTSSLKGEIALMEEAKKGLSRQDPVRREFNSRIRKIEDRLRAIREEDRGILKRTKELAAKRRRAESAKIYDAMRISKLGFRGDLDPAVRCENDDNA